MKLAAAMAILLSLLDVTFASAQDTPSGMTRVTPGATTRVFIMAAFDDACRSLAAPAIEITQAPKKGAVQFREGQSTTVQFSVSGKCTGSQVTGTGIYYAARADALGEDTFSMSARLASGEVATRTFRMFISEGL
jgi:hypothetical protein